ncbi:MAG: nitrate reductase [Candidatus Omnitrophica bacterium]|nr:nitrate reductase [Candidatus Omnitrophota bacterium]MDE2231428.1 nitrate reductase [Candidatus Omnitrophota bacterium]
MRQLKDLIYQRTGPLSDELELKPSALGMLPQRLMPERLVRVVCGFCSTGCSLDVHLKNGKAVNLTPTHGYPVNSGEACPKGWEALTPLWANDRATTPYLRKGHGRLEAVKWDTALRTFVSRFKDIQGRWGRDSIAFLSTGQIPIEEMAYLGALAKFGMGMVHGDGNTRQCMATAAVAYKQSFGFDAPPFTYRDFEESDCLIFVGANPCIAHPIMWQRVCRNPHRPTVVVLDPRKTETAMAATHHYALKPKSDLVLLYGLAHVLIKRGWIDQVYIDRHTAGFEEVRRHVQEYTPGYVSRRTGLSAGQIEELAGLIHQGKRVSFWWMVGVNQGHEAVRTAQAIINLALMTGNIGRPGTGANSITGQCNAMGSRLFSNTTNLLGHHDFQNPQHRGRIAKILKMDESLIPAENSLPYNQIIEQIALGKIKGLWIIATNPVHSWIASREFKQILKNLEFLVVQDMYHTSQTAQAADLILPAAGWGEKEGTFINSERRFGLLRKVAQAPGEALADFYIFKLIARYWGCEELFKEWQTPEKVFGILKEISRGTPCDFTGIGDYAMIERSGGIQWPFPEGASLENNERRLFENGKYFYPDGKAKFLVEDPRPAPEEACGQFPFVLLTGRGTSSQWHTQTRTGKSAVLRKMYPSGAYVEINPEDACKFSIKDGQHVYITTRRGQVKVRALVTAGIQQGQLFMPMHYELTNHLTMPSFDPYSYQPSYKMAAARLSKGPYYA